MSIRLSFLGGAGTVTGSKYLLDNGKHRLLVDCGLFQGYKTLRLRNWAPPPVAPKSLDAVVLTHAHIDHSGYLPLLAKQGFDNRVWCSEATADLCRVLLPDSGHLQEQDAEFANRRGYSKHHPALPLYSEADAERALHLLKPAPFHRPIALPGGAEMRLCRAGHILGAASVRLTWEGVSIVFSGDIGRYGDPLMMNPEIPEPADFLLMESTYGDRQHDSANPQDLLAAIITRVTRRGGTVIVPAFAVGRAQLLLYHIGCLKQAGRLDPALPVFLDSPMAIDATEIFRRHAADQRLTMEQMTLLNRGVRYVHTAQESKILTTSPEPKIIISASGMATGGRVLHHLEHYAPDPRNAILFAGFQAGGTRGAAMVGGARQFKSHGRYYPVRAEVQNLSMLSAHADRGELLRWARAFGKPGRGAFIIHGEPAAADGLRLALEEELGWTCTVPEHGQSVVLS